MPNIDLQETQEELKWLETKLEIKALRRTSRTVKRGEVYGCDFGYNIGSELRGYHPCVIIQNDSTTINLRTVCVAPITHASARTNIPASLVPLDRQIDANGKILIEGYADIANIRTVSKARLTNHKTNLSTDDMKKIDSALSSITGLYHYYKKVSEKLAKAQEHAKLRSKKIQTMRSILFEIDKMPSEELPDAVRKKIQEALNA